jgi:hypothetical protein
MSHDSTGTRRVVAIGCCFVASRTFASPRLRQSRAALGFGYGLNEERLRAKRWSKESGVLISNEAGLETLVGCGPVHFF